MQKNSVTGGSRANRLRVMNNAGDAPCQYGEVVLVATDASKRANEHALDWALANVVVQSGDKIVFLAVLPCTTSTPEYGWRKWGLGGECAAVSVKGGHEEFKEVHARCAHMIEKLRNLHNLRKVQITMEILQFAERGSISCEAKRMRATWVILDRNLKKEAKDCLQELESNVVIVNRNNNPKILRLNLKRRNMPTDEVSYVDSSSALLEGLSMSFVPKGFDQVYWEGFTSGSASSSFESPKDKVKSKTILPTETQYETASSSFESPVFLKDVLRDRLPFEAPDTQKRDSQRTQQRSLSDFLDWKLREKRKEYSHADKAYSRTTETKGISLGPTCRKEHEGTALERVSSVRKHIHLSKHSPAQPPPLCSTCQHKTPIFGKPPRRFTYAELQLATGDFSNTNFLAEGGFGSVYTGVLPDGQKVAVKQHKLLSTQGDKEFCSEVEVLSCAQQRNLVTLVGYCVEDKRRLLVYEFVCNGSLDSHLYGIRSRGSTLEWWARQKIAVGAARALRYLHEECRVGCVVHRDMRPNNILLTHDFEPMVGDFGLARWQPDGDLGVETRVIGAFGYLAPEYTQTGQITEKADVYSFGVVLLEIVTGRKAVDMSRRKGEMCLSEWARPLLRERSYENMVDERLKGRYCAHEVENMLYAASLCVEPNPSIRPRMSQVLRLLEGDGHNSSGSPLSVLSPRGLSYQSNKTYSSSSSSNSGSPLNPFVKPKHSRRTIPSNARKPVCIHNNI